MARSQKNIVVEGIHGKIGQLLFRHWFGNTIISLAPRQRKTSSPAQLQRQALFRAASQYAAAAMRDAGRHAFYRAMARPGQTVRNVAIADYCKPPEISEPDRSRYHGGMGAPIRVRATDNGRVESVHVKIENSSGMVEEGNALMEADGLHWMYHTTAMNNDLAGTLITITATDMAGREQRMVL